MKKILLIICLVLTYANSFSQDGYIGVVYDKSTFTIVRPYVFSTFKENRLVNKMTYSPVFGMGMNTLGNLSVQFGFDVYQPITPKKDYRILMGMGIELLGYVDVYKEYLPSLRLGLETKRTVFMITSNYVFNSVFVMGVWGYEPVMKPTLGLFYRIKE